MKRSSLQLAQNLLHDVRRAVDLKATTKQLPIAQRNAFLRSLAAQLEADRGTILGANRRDCDRFLSERNIDKASRPNFALTASWFDRMLQSVERIAEQPDPLGVAKRLPNTHACVSVDEVTVPMGMVSVVSRWRPRIMLDGITMALKAGNVVLVDSGAAVGQTARAMATSVNRALTRVDIPQGVVVYLDDVEELHGGTSRWLKMHDLIDLAVVCGSNRLYDYVARNTSIPIVRSTGHVCSVFVDKDADLAIAIRVVRNCKVHRLNATNAINSVVIHKEFSGSRELLEMLLDAGVCLVGEAELRQIIPGAGLATEEDWMGVQNGFANFNVLCVKFVSCVDQAVSFMSAYGSGQSDGIVSTNLATIDEFIMKSDSAVVCANASTRFSTGDCFGLGADLAIATSRVHCRGPVSLKSLTTTKFVVRALEMTKGAVRD